MTSGATVGSSPGDGSVGGGTLDGDSASGGVSGSEGSEGSEGPPGLCLEDADCADGVFCNGPEACGPNKPGADAQGCVSGTPPCADGANCNEEQGVCVTDCDLGVDADMDGVNAAECGGDDCDDSNPGIYPGATEVCDLVDDDCDPETIGSADEDGDGVVSSGCCNGFACGPDCDDGLHGIVGPGDWAHCSACGASCQDMEACMGGICMPARRVFVTSMTNTGNFGGAMGAHAFCQAHADDPAVALGGVFMAFLTGGDADLEALEHANVPYVMLDGTQIAANWNDLTDDGIATPLDQNELRQVVGTDFAWTGIGGPAMFDNHCEGWTLGVGGCGEGGPCGYVGVIADADASWDGNGWQAPCNVPLALYCIEQMSN